MTACIPINDPFQCPGQVEIWRQILALLPRGRAWQTHEQVFARFEFGALEADVGDFEIGDSPIGAIDIDRLTVMQQFWLAYAQVLAEVNARACALIEEMFCDTTAELLAEWFGDYGLPDGCGPWRTLCEKVNATGGCTTAYLVELALDLGWTITISDMPTWILRSGSHEPSLDIDFVGDRVWMPNLPQRGLYVNVLLSQSPAYVAANVRSLSAGVGRAGFNYAGPLCPPGAESIVCLIERFRPANIPTTFAYDGVILV